MTGYYNRDRVEQVARQVNHDTISALRDVAKSNATAILVGYYEVRANGIYNAAMLIGANGAILTNYRKRALYGNWEHSAFVPGNEPVLAEYKGIRISVLICFDIEFPELARECARNGADLIAVPTSLVRRFGPDLRSACSSKAAVPRRG